jgi:DNA adenine methylase
VVTYNVVKDDTDKLIQLLKNFKSKHSKDFFMEIRERDKDKNFKKEKSKIERAARFIYLNRTCFN